MKKSKQILFLVGLFGLGLLLSGCGGGADGGSGAVSDSVLGITSLTIEGSVTDNLSPMSSINVDGKAVAVEANDFLTTVDIQQQCCFFISAWDTTMNYQVMVVSIE